MTSSGSVSGMPFSPRRPVAGHLRVAFHIDDASSTNARLNGPAGLQLTLFQLD